MKLINYTTSVSADKSIIEIEKILSQFGASAVMKEFRTDGRIICLSFKLDGKGYKIPLNSEGVETVMYKKGAKKESQQLQAYRVACRIIKDWIHAQLSLIISGQAQPDQVLLPYLWDGKRTLYEAYRDGKLQIENKEI
jgi:hypothetical protein